MCPGLTRWLNAIIALTILVPTVPACTDPEAGRTPRGASPAGAEGTVVIAAAQSNLGRATAPGLMLAHSTLLGLYLADASRRTLYMVESDAEGTSTCYGRCAMVWPPFIVTETPVAVDSLVDPDRIGTTRRRDGTRQATYNRHPLYYYLGDSASGSTRGHRVEDSWGEWYLIESNGTRAAVLGPCVGAACFVAIR